MPRAAVAFIRVDQVQALSDLPGLLVELASSRATALSFMEPAGLGRRREPSSAENALNSLKVIGSPSQFSCPDCGGVLFELDDKGLVRFRCQTGHAFSLRSLASTQEEVADDALWTSLRVLLEKEAILRRLSDMACDRAATHDYLQKAEEIAAAAAALRMLTSKIPDAASFDAVLTK